MCVCVCVCARVLNFTSTCKLCSIWVTAKLLFPPEFIFAIVRRKVRRGERVSADDPDSY